MARVGLTIRGRISPDVAAMMSYLSSAIDRFVATDMMGCDARVIALARRYAELVALGPDALFVAEFQQDTVSIEPTDLLLDLVAKFRAVENALRIARPET